MQHCSCTVFLSGDLHHGVYKPDVTVAEIAVLRAIHGDDGVAEIQPTFMERGRSNAAELERLRVIYNGSNLTKEGKRLLEEIFPGRNPSLPVTLADIGEDYPTEEVKTAKKASKAKAPAPEPEPESAAGALLGGD